MDAAQPFEVAGRWFAHNGVVPGPRVEGSDSLALAEELGAPEGADGMAYAAERLGPVPAALLLLDPERMELWGLAQRLPVWIGRMGDGFLLCSSPVPAVGVSEWLDARTLRQPWGLLGSDWAQITGR